MPDGLLKSGTTDEDSAGVRFMVLDYERLPSTLAGLHFIAFAAVMLSRIPSLTTLQSA